MPLYDFRCSDCTDRREVNVSIAQASGLELICVTCGGTMRKTISHTVAFIADSSATTSPSDRARPMSTERGHRCSDGVVKLTRPNPFAPTLPSTRQGG